MSDLIPVYDTAEQVLAGHNATATTRRLIQTAIAGGLRPHLEPPPRRKPRKGTPPPREYLVLVNHPTRDGLFGGLHISEVTGLVMYANLCYGNSGTERRYLGVAEVRRELNGWWRSQHVTEVS